MAETTDDPLELTGCKHCWPESAEAAWDARRSLRELAIWIDEPHFTMRGLRCAHCSGNFISVFMESIDWTNGDDAQTWMTVPVTADELARVEALLPSSIEVALRVVPSQRRSLHRDHPSGCDARIGWTTGIDISSHD